MNAVARTTQRSVWAALGSEGPGGSSWGDTEAVGIDIPDGIRIPDRMSTGVDAGASPFGYLLDADGDLHAPDSN